MPVADVSGTYTDLVTTVFSSGVVSGQEQSDVVTYVVAISSPSE